MLQQLSAGRLMRKLGRDFDWLATFHFYSAMQIEFHNLWLARKGKGGEGEEGGFYFILNSIILLWLISNFFWYLKFLNILRDFIFRMTKSQFNFIRNEKNPGNCHTLWSCWRLKILVNINFLVWRIKGYRSCWCWYNDKYIKLL